MLEEKKKEVHTALRNFLHVQRLKATPERFAVLDEIYSTHFHFEAEDILVRMRKKK